MALPINFTSTVSDIVYNYTNSLEGIPLVIDNGSYNCRVGFANQKNPYLIFKNVVSKPRLKKDSILVGNDISDLESLRNTIKIAFDRNLVTNLEVQEYVFDHIFTKMGITSNSVDHPVVINEAACNPNACRSQMSELLFECYKIPKVCYYIDALASYYNFLESTGEDSGSISNIGGLQDGLVVSLGYHTVHLLPIIAGRLESRHVKRINIGGAYCDWYMQRLLQLKYPPHMPRITLSAAESLNHEYSRVTSNYRQEMIALKQPDALKEETTIVQLPYLQTEGNLSSEQLQQRRQYQIQRLKEAHKKRHQERLNRDKDHLKNLQLIDDLVTMGYNSHCKPKNKLEINAAIRKSLKASGLKDVQDMKDSLAHYKKSVHRLQCQVDGIEYKAEEMAKPASTTATSYNLVDIADEDLDPEELKQKRRQLMMKGAAERREKIRALKEAHRKKMVEGVKQLEEKRSDDFLGWLTSLRFKRQSLIEGRIQRKNRKSGTSAGVGVGGGGTGVGGGGGGSDGDRKLLQQHRIRVMAAELQGGAGGSSSGAGASSRRGQGSTGGGGSGHAVDNGSSAASHAALAELAELVEHDSEDSEAEQEQLTQLDTLLAQYDPDFSKDLGGAGLKVDLANFYQMHLTTEKMRVPEVYFQPGLVGCDQAGLSESFSWLLTGLPVPLQDRLCSRVLLTGAAARLPGFRDRVHAEITALRPWQSFVAVSVAPEPQLSAWHGACRMSRLSNFPDWCVTRADYEEMGHDYLKENFIGNRYYSPLQPLINTEESDAL